MRKAKFVIGGFFTVKVVVAVMAIHLPFTSGMGDEQDGSIFFHYAAAGNNTEFRIKGHMSQS
ncbi:MAG: hypothetical protein H6R14_1297 [Proteobacteria bacterium]|nr:hypothetical protein [Pseudomonadota bacterium]